MTPETGEAEPNGVSVKLPSAAESTPVPLSAARPPGQRAREAMHDQVKSPGAAPAAMVT